MGGRNGQKMAWVAAAASALRSEAALSSVSSSPTFRDRRSANRCLVGWGRDRVRCECRLAEGGARELRVRLCIRRNPGFVGPEMETLLGPFFKNKLTKSQI